ncbi:MAG: hypothetical protein LC624_10915 [Halobacteriales archaeon]|nr:hypothetical protein [Halobacteriales archaeon]
MQEQQQTRSMARNPFAEKLEHEIDNASLAQGLAEGTLEDVVIDLRKPEEYRQAHIPGAFNVHIDDVVAFAGQQPHGTRFVVSCYHIACLLATRAAARLTDEEYAVRELRGGWDWWQRKEQPTVAGEAPGSWPG